MPNFDWMPVVSQAKSLVQLACGDVDGACETFNNFTKECPGVSQVRSLGQCAVGDFEGAWETQKSCAKTVNGIANKTPVVGHVKGVLHHVVGDHDGGNEAFYSATKTAFVSAVTTGACIATGGAAAIPVAISSSYLYDTTASGLTEKPKGNIKYIEDAAKDPSAGKIFDAIASPVLTGWSASKHCDHSDDHHFN